jgi:hypothetical protein
MSEDQVCRGTHDERVKILLATCGCRLASLDEIVHAVREACRGKGWTWVDKWVEDEGPKWVNDRDTVVFEYPSGKVTGEKSLEFTQMVWRCQPTDFWFQVWSDRCFVRMWWDRNRALGKERSPEQDRATQ